MAQSDFSQLEKVLQKEMQRITQEVFEIVENNALNLLQQHIDDGVFGEPEGWYKRRSNHDSSGGFKQAFVWKDVKDTVKHIVSTLHYDWQSMRPPSPNDNYGYTHGNYKEGKDRRSNLADLLNVNGFDMGNDFGGRERKAYWDNFEKDLENQIMKWFDVEFARRGITRQK